MTERKSKLLAMVGRLLCLLGFHDFRVVNVTFGFGPGETVEKVECKRCGLRITRQGK